MKKKIVCIISGKILKVGKRKLLVQNIFLISVKKNKYKNMQFYKVYIFFFEKSCTSLFDGFYIISYGVTIFQMLQ